ncbi:hypothetical protein SDC9_203305 [bioreactor metagenome]|uniref:Uncharacterized protein n=1 Tax=bioreactor metagenome TaxID=1076179 RepID=A0A645IWA0_9ZZZZ
MIAPLFRRRRFLKPEEFLSGPVAREENIAARAAPAVIFVTQHRLVVVVGAHPEFHAFSDAKIRQTQTVGHGMEVGKTAHAIEFFIVPPCPEQHGRHS